MSLGKLETRNSKLETLKVWHAVASVRLAVILLVLIAIASTIGIVLPQPESFTASTYLEQRLPPHAEHPLKPAEFVALARAAGILRGDSAFDALAKRVGEGTLGDEDWPGFAEMLAQRLRNDESPEPCLRLSYVDSFGPGLGRLLLFLRFHVLFTSVWFRVLCGLLLVNLLACSTERLPGQCRMAFGRRASDDPAWYRRRATHAEAVVGHGGADAVEAALRASGFRTRRCDGPQGTTIEGSRGWLGALAVLWQPLGQLAGLGRLGAQVVHLGVILIALGGFVSGFLAFRHPQLLRKGDIVAVPRASERKGEAGHTHADWREKPGEPAQNALFRMRLRSFEFRSDPRGKPEYYGSHVSLLDTEPPTDLTIEVNRPLVYRGFHVYQQSYQPDYRGITSVSLIVAKVRREEGSTTSPHGEGQPIEILQEVSLALPPDTPVQVPGTDLTLRIIRYFPHWQMSLEQGPDGRVVAGEARNMSDDPANPAVRIRLEAPGKRPRERWVPLPFRSGEARPGGVLDYGDYRVVPIDFSPEYATWLTFKTQPAMLPVWIGCGVMMLGIVLCFYCNHERVWALVRPLEGGRAEVFLAGDSFKWRERFRERFDAVVRAIG